MSFIQRAREAAEAAAARAQEAAATAGRTAGDPATAERINKGLASAGQGAREAVGMARKGMHTVIERIDPGTLADLIIKATALQEMTNRSLRVKGSPYRISEIGISASIPPGVTFSIGRIDDEPEPLGEVVVSSAELVAARSDGAELVLALDGTTVDEDVVSAPSAEAGAGPAPAGSTPAGSTPAGPTPAGPTPIGSTPTGSTPTGSTLAGSPPPGFTPPGSIDTEAR